MLHSSTFISHQGKSENVLLALANLINVLGDELVPERYHPDNY
jgi:hypothetical protein